MGQLYRRAELIEKSNPEQKQTSCSDGRRGRGADKRTEEFTQEGVSGFGRTEGRKVTELANSRAETDEGMMDVTGMAERR